MPGHAGPSTPQSNRPRRRCIQSGWCSLRRHSREPGAAGNWLQEKNVVSVKDFGSAGLPCRRKRTEFRTIVNSRQLHGAVRPVNPIEGSVGVVSCRIRSIRLDQEEGTVRHDRIHVDRFKRCNRVGAAPRRLPYPHRERRNGFDAAVHHHVQVDAAPPMPMKDERLAQGGACRRCAHQDGDQDQPAQPSQDNLCGVEWRHPTCDSTSHDASKSIMHGTNPHCADGINRQANRLHANGNPCFVEGQPNRVRSRASENRSHWADRDPDFREWFITTTPRPVR